MAKCCVVSGCDATNRDFGTFLFCFPKADDLRRRWTRALGKPADWTVPDSEAFICWSHFESKAILREESSFRRLADAVPSQYLGLKTSDSSGRVEQFCRLCAKELASELLGNNLNEMHRSEDSRMLLNFLLPNDCGKKLSEMACDECFVCIKLTMRFIRNCEKATRQLDEMAQRIPTNIKEPEPISEVKMEMDEFGEIPVDSVEAEIKVEASSLGGFSDRDDDADDSDLEDDIPLASRLRQKVVIEELQCSYCSFRCSKRNQLASHMKKHRDLLPKQQKVVESNLSCPYCPFSCNKPNQLASHKKKHKKLQHQMPMVTKSLNDDSLDTKHKKPPKAKMSTEDCLKMEHPNESLSDSIEQNGPESPAFLDHTSDDGEDDSAPEILPNGTLQCPDCPYTCARLNQLASHKKKHNSKKSKDPNKSDKKTKDIYECEFCDFTCKLRRQMAGHRASHSNQIKKSKPSGKERDHMCSICGKILSTRGSFFVHMKYHNDQRDYSCQLCDKKFYSKRDVTMHVESFHEKKVFECEICGVKCTWKNALYKHMRKHDSSSFKHECSYCGKKFIAANELRLHVWRHTGQQLNCEICGAGYRFNFLLTQHKIREHGMQIDGVKLYKRFQKGTSGGVGGRQDPSETSSAADEPQLEPIPQHREQHAHEEASSSSYSSDIPSGYPQHMPTEQQHPLRLQQPLPQSAPHLPLPFHPLGHLVGQQLPPGSQTNPFGQVGNY